MKYELAQMCKQQESNTSSKIVPCSIVNTASIAGLRGMPEFSAYCAAKHAIVG
jgi:NAD(P)-dependent dehydrogenase (short-subunit alcohol dehydrogenase family)